MKIANWKLQIGVWVIAVVVGWAGGAGAVEGLGIERRGKSVFVREGGERLAILRDGAWIPSAWGPREVRLGNGVTLSLPRTDDAKGRVEFSREGKAVGSFGLTEQVRELLKQDDLWPPGRAKVMRQIPGGILMLLTSPVALKDSVLALLTINASGPSGQPTVEQQLVRLSASPEPRLELLRPLDFPPNWEYGLSQDPCPRVFRAGNRLLLFTKPSVTQSWDSQPKKVAPPSELVEIDENGKTLRVAAKLPPRKYPAGLLDQRWLILAEPDEAAPSPLWFYDLPAGKAAPIPGDWKGYFHSSYLYVPPTGGKVLVYRYTQPVEASKTFIVSVPSGRRAGVPNPSGSVMHYLWRGKAFIVDGERRWVAVYDGRGRLVRKLAIPAEGVVGGLE